MIVALSLLLAPPWLRASAGAAACARGAAGSGTTILRRMLDSFRRSMSCRGLVGLVAETVLVAVQRGDTSPRRSRREVFKR
jgi:hypothetical protein